MNQIPMYQVVRVTAHSAVSVIGKASGNRFDDLSRTIRACGHPTEFLTRKEVGGRCIAIDSNGTRYYFR
jgi:hypothetical protein